MTPTGSSPDLVRWESLHGVRPGSTVDDPPAGWSGLVSISRTPEESSVIGPWQGRGLGPYRAWSVPGPLDSNLVGVLARLLDPLRAAGVPVLAVSTHDTDWLLVESGRANDAEVAWRNAGIVVEDAPSAS